MDVVGRGVESSPIRGDFEWSLDALIEFGDTSDGLDFADSIICKV